ncbi:predicted protein [Nematostella vectensis]|uniref:Biogenesis of lysosome-related organelles complex 1 subunit 3 n=1 Tax=Nematostella vectensis TaxID=45351 RepID=A7RPC6_NEMVE|nr:ribosome biogenesis protein BOP1 homolog [Nematostella vectensis]EDO46662.1 predicted protein [Nematostella vectensis]|eukprot:XP_001638725.1 predicted protein [Nematostella vectensis]
MSSNVTSGEGDESDDDTCQSLSFMKNTMVTSTMVSGEASETDEEDDADDQQESADDDKMHQEPVEIDIGDTAIPIKIDNLEVEDPLATKQSKVRRQKLVFKHDTPMHRKLRERNLQLRSSLVEGTTQLYKAASNKLQSSGFFLNKAQAAAEEVAYQSKVILEDLDALQVALQSIVDMSVLPTIHTKYSSS